MIRKFFVLTCCFLFAASVCSAENNLSRDLSSKLSKKDRILRNVSAPLNLDTLHNDTGVAVQHVFVKSQLQVRSGKFFLSPMISYSLKPDVSKVQTIWFGPAINYEF